MNDTRGSANVLTESERHRLLVEWNSARADYPTSQCLHELFEAQVERTPDSVAVVFEGQKLTYRELDARANQLAHYLGKLGVGPDVLVGLCLDRSPEMVVALLGVLKAGGAYVPLDPGYPEERVRFMLEDSKAPVLVTQSRLRERVRGAAPHVIYLGADWDAMAREPQTSPRATVTSDHLAYVIYTSGSTGRPKGVMIPHRAICNHMFWMQRAFPIGPMDAVLQKTPFSFDASVWEFYAPLMVGGRLVIGRPGGHQDAAYLTGVIGEQTVTILQLVPSQLRMLLAEPSFEGCRSLRRVFCGGEVLPVELQDECFRRLPTATLHNLYGPTEATIDSTVWTCVPEPGARSVPIGCPIDNAEVYILDAQRRPAPAGEAGELYIGGAGLARGYLNRPELTRERFVPHPFSRDPEARLYRTGDLARFRADGAIEFLGRVDHQVKLRGYRIELGEIEAVLKQHPAVRDAVVLAREDEPGDVRLVVYAILHQAVAASIVDLRRFMQEKLPSYMVAQALVFLDAFPLTPNGKVDRKALPAPDRGRPELEGEYVAPRTRLEEMLAVIWADLLGLSRVGVFDNFFELGGHSLAATQLVSRVREAFHADLPLVSVFDAPTVADLAKLIEQAVGDAQDQPVASIRPAPRNQPLPLSFAQERIWFIQQLDPANKAYTFQATLQFRGALNVPALERGLNEIVRRHEILRTTFPSVNGQPVQVIHDFELVNLPLIDLHLVPEDERERAVRQVINDEIQKPFNLGQLPLIRWVLLRLRTDEHLLLHVEHHLLHDGWSFNVFLGELRELYTAFADGQPSPLSPLSIQFADFAYWQRQWMRGEVAESQLTYWKRKLAGNPPVLELPSDRPRPAVQRYRGSQRRVELPLSLSEALRAFSRREGMTLFMTMLAALEVLFRRYTDQEDFCIGSGIANRRWRETESVIGMVINTVPLRADLSGDPTVRELLDRVRSTTLEAYMHQDMPFDRIVQTLGPERSLSHSPLFQVMFGFHDAPMGDLNFPGLEVGLTGGIGNGSAKFDLNLTVIPRWDQRVGRPSNAQGLTQIWEYDTDLFDETRIIRMISHYQMLLGAIVADPALRVSQLPVLTETERHQLLTAWNNTQASYPTSQCIHELFEAQVERTPDAVAVVFGRASLTYRELNGRANRLAHHLRSLGVGPEVLAGICVERSPEMVIGLLGILKAGGAYVALDPAYPKERLAFILEDTHAPVLLTQQRLVDTLPSAAAHIVSLDSGWNVIARHSDQNLPWQATEENLAYVIYTSGSTGRPKGVAIEHHSTVTLLHWAGERFSPEELAGVLASTSVCFDLSVFEMFAPLSWGGKIILAENALQLPSLPAAEQVTLVNTVPSAMAELLRVDGVPLSVRTVCLAGEPLTPRLVEQLYERKTIEKVYDLYGPSEDTTYTTVALRTPNGPATIGRPISNTQVYILDRHMNPVPIGVPGELHIGGGGLARGYLNRPELTAERFISNAFHEEPGARLYKTGDLARYLPDGNIEFVGRMDHQVKIRGYRIELGEIETVLRQHSAIGEAVVLAREDTPGDKRLVAYIVPRAADASVNELRDFLGRSLPKYMIPSAFVLLEALPLTPNGKVDRRALPTPDQERPKQEGSYVAPREPVEFLLTQIWEEVLGIQPIGIRDNFFELGGHSLLAVRLMGQIERLCGRKLPVATLFAGATIEHLAWALREQQDADFRSSLVEIHPNGSKRPFFFLHGDFGVAVYCLNLARCLGQDQPFYALAPHGMDDPDFPETLEAMAAAHLKTVRNVQPEGPYLLGGYCNGGVVAFEMARQLRAQGERVDLLALVGASVLNAHFMVLHRLIDRVGSLVGLSKNRRSSFFQSMRDATIRFRRRWRYYIERSTTLMKSGLDGLIAFARGKTKTACLGMAHLVGCGRAPGDTPSAEALNNAFPILDVYRKVLRSYIPQPYHGRVTLLWPNEEAVESYEDPVTGWLKVAGEVVVHGVPGDHLTTVTTHVNALGIRLKQCVECAQANAQTEPREMP